MKRAVITEKGLFSGNEDMVVINADEDSQKSGENKKKN